MKTAQPNTDKSN